jgi:hypothetical protein
LISASGPEAAADGKIFPELTAALQFPCGLVIWALPKLWFPQPSAREGSAVADCFIEEQPDYLPNIFAMIKITTAPRKPPPKII